MRIAFFVKSKRRTRTTRSIAAALRRAGHDVRVLNERRRRRWLGESAARAWTVRSVERFAPAWLLIHANDVSEPVFDALAPHHRTALFTPDCWPPPIETGDLGLAARVDLLLTVAAGQIGDLQAAGVRRAVHLAEACDPSLYHPEDRVEEAWGSDVAFIGKTSRDSERHRARTRLVRSVCERFDTRVYGRGWEACGIRPARRDVLPRHYRKVCRGAKVTLGRDWTADVRWYFSNRTWFTLGCGGFLVTNHVPGLEEIFTNHRELVWYRSDEECLDLIAHYLERPAERRRIAEAGRAFVLEHRTYDHFARDLVDRLEGRSPAFPPGRRPPPR